MLCLLSVCASACNAPSTEKSKDREVALAHVQAGAQLLQRSQALQQQGWSVAALEDATVEWLRASGEKTSPGEAEYTRVILDVTKDGMAAALILSWSPQGPDQLSVQPARRADALAVAQAIAAAAPGANQGAGEVATYGGATEVQAASACNGEGATCAGSGRCCNGLSCFGPDNHERCNCTTRWTSEYPQRGGIDPVRCLPNPEDPFSEGFWMRHWTGCDSGGSYGLASGMCGTEVVPAYTEHIWDEWICFAGSPC
jgi:hypothetical protein